jgi:hypothetical protein
MATLKETIAERVAALGPAVQEGVVTVLVEQVKDKRVKAVLTALSLLEEKQKELKKIKPEQTFDGEGKVASEFYTKANNELRKKTTEAITKIEKALEKALDPTAPTYDDLFKVVQNKGAAEPKEETAAE